MSNIIHLNTHHRYHGFSCSVDTPVQVPVHPPDLRRAEELNHALALERELADIARRRSGKFTVNRNFKIQ